MEETIMILVESRKMKLVIDSLMLVLISGRMLDALLNWSLSILAKMVTF